MRPSETSGRRSNERGIARPRLSERFVVWRNYWGLALLFLASVLLYPTGCKTSSEPSTSEAIAIQLDAVPLLLEAADTLDTATIWATVLEHGEPISDSTVVSFAASNGKIDAEAMTMDGLARVVFVPGRNVGVAAIVAQVKTVRDTVLVTLF